jgi:hypothetical protein
VQHLRVAFQVLFDHKLFLKFSKYAFAQQQVEYLGHVISDKGVATDPNKIEVMLKWPRPHSLTEVRDFLGLIGYYWKFVKHYGIIAKPLAALLKCKQFSWSQEAMTTFQALKNAMSSVHVLTLSDFDTPFEIETDAYETGVGAILQQRGHPIAVFSKALSKANQRLSTYEKEFLVMLMVVDKWRPYLLKLPFVIRTDHKSLCHLQDQSLSTDIQKKAISKLVGLQFTLQYKKGLRTLWLMPYLGWVNSSRFMQSLRWCLFGCRKS